MKRIHERLNDSLIPPIRQVFEFRNTVTNARNLFCRVWVVPKSFPQPRIQNILEHCRADGDANGTSKTSGQI